MNAAERAARDAAIKDMTSRGVTYAQVGERFGLSRQRIEQILFPRKTHARKLVSEAVQSGILQRPEACNRCRSHRKLDAHHADYARPLDVEWLCVECHGAAHSVQGPRPEPPVFVPPPDDVGAAAVALAALRMVKMTPEQRTAVAKIAAAARWKKKPDAELDGMSR